LKRIESTRFDELSNAPISAGSLCDRDHEPNNDELPKAANMTSRRVAKMAQAIRETVGMAILADLRDPRVENATVTSVEVSPDMRYAKVNVSVMGDEAKQKLCLHGLDSAAGYLQRKLSDRIETRYTPRLSFVLDQGVKHSLEVARILKEVLPDDPAPAEDEAELAEGETDEVEAPESDSDENELNDSEDTLENEASDTEAIDDSLGAARRE
jgi:ribosome-binding factor A